MKNPRRSPLDQVLGLIHRPEGMMPCGNMRSCSKGGAHPLQHIEFRSKITIAVAAAWPLRPLKLINGSLPTLTWAKLQQPGRLGH